MKRVLHRTIASEADHPSTENGGGHGQEARPVLLATLLLALVGCSRHLGSDLGEAPAVPVTVVAAMETNVPVELQATGHVTTLSTAAVRSLVNGVVEKVHFQPGEEVKKGNLLFTIDPQFFQAALDRAAANLQEDQARMQCEQIKARQNAELVQQGILPRGACSCADEVTLATIAADEAAAANARLQRSFCDIRSPITGRTCAINVGACEWVSKLKTVLVTINQMKPIYVDFTVPPQELARLRTCLGTVGKLPVKASVRGCDQYSSTGELTSLDYATDDGSGMVFLRAIFPNQDEMLLPGGHVNVVLTLTTLTNAVVVPSESVQISQRGQHVYVVNYDSTVEARPVEVGNQTGSETVLRNGIKRGEQVVTSCQIRLAPGMKVIIQNPTAVAKTTHPGSSD